MKLINKSVDKGGQGYLLTFEIFPSEFYRTFSSPNEQKLMNNFGCRSVVLMAEESEDMWHAYNLIAEGDYVRATTIRKVQNETATGSSSSSRVRTTLKISVENIDFDTQACMLRLKGRNIEENQYVKVSKLCVGTQTTPRMRYGKCIRTIYLFV